jgi:hypothetical protein
MQNTKHTAGSFCKEHALCMTWGDEHILPYYYVCLYHQNIYNETTALHFQMGTINLGPYMYCSVERIPGHLRSVSRFVIPSLITLQGSLKKKK